MKRIKNILSQGYILLVTVTVAILCIIDRLIMSFFVHKPIPSAHEIAEFDYYKKEWQNRLYTYLWVICAFFASILLVKLYVFIDSIYPHLPR